jgi:hypothetical protein
MSTTLHAIDQAIAAHCKAEGLSDRAVGWVVLLPTVDRDGDTVHTSVIVVHAERDAASFAEAVVDSAHERTSVVAH